MLSSSPPASRYSPVSFFPPAPSGAGFLLCFSLCRGRMWRREVKRLVEKITCTSDEERVRFEEEGYVVVSVGYFPENGKPFYTMERGSDWSQKLGSK